MGNNSLQKNGFTAPIKNPEKTSHQNEWNLMTLENSWSQKFQNSAKMLFPSEDQSKSK